MKITYAVPLDLGDTGGALQHVLGLCRHAAANGVEARLLCLGDVGRAPVGLNVTAFPLTGSAMSRVAGFARAALEHLRHSPRPDWVYTRPFPLDYPLFTRPLRKLGLRYAYEINTLWASELRSQGKNFKALLYPACETFSLRHASALLPVTPEITRDAAARGGNHIPTLVAGNGIEIPPVPSSSVAQIRAKWRLPMERILLVMAGFTRPWHGHDRLLAALPSFPENVDLVLIGADTPEAAAAVQGPRVHVLPWLSHEEVSEVVWACDVGVAPLAFDRAGLAEGRSLKVRHYMAMGKPLVHVTREAPEIEGSGFAFRAESSAPSALAKTVREALSGTVPPETVRAHAITHLSWEGVARKTFDFLREVSQ